MAEIEIKTAPADFRFPTTNQTRHCFTRYIEYHRCLAAKGKNLPNVKSLQDIIDPFVLGNGSKNGMSRGRTEISQVPSDFRWAKNNGGAYDAEDSVHLFGLLHCNKITSLEPRSGCLLVSEFDTRPLYCLFQLYYLDMEKNDFIERQKIRDCNVLGANCKEGFGGGSSSLQRVSIFHVSY